MVFRCRGRKSGVSGEELKASIVKIARHHFALHGFQGTSLKDIAREAGVAGSLINYHFNDKEGLFRACFEGFARARMEAINRLLSEPQSRDDLRVRLEIFVEEMITSVMEDPHSFEIMDREMRAGNPMVLKLFQDTLLLAFQNVVQFFDQAKKRGLLRADVDPMTAAVILYSAACDGGRKDFMAKKFFNFSFQQAEVRKQFSQSTVDLIMNGVVQ